MTTAKIHNMEQLAQISGLSRPTISRYFHNPASVRRTTRAKIEDVLERYDYIPNIFAINQNRKLTRNVGIVVPYLADPFFAEIARAIEQRCIAAGYRPTMFSAHGQPDLECDILDGLRRLKPAGVLLAPLGRASDRKTIEKFCADVPTVLFDSMLPDVGLAFVGSDAAQLGMLIVDYLCRSGEPPCFLEMQTPANPNANRRRDAYVNAMQALGKTPQVVQLKGAGWGLEDIGHRQGGKALREGGFATNTVLCSNDRLAIGFLTACYEARVSVGFGKEGVMRVAGQDDHPFSRFTCPPLTTVAQDYDAISHHAVKTLLRAIEEEGETQLAETTLFPGRLVMRSSA